MQITNAYSEPTIQYDKHGNILSLQRYGAPAEQEELIDDLEYMYRGNKLIAVHDKGNQLKGFANNAANQHEYDYDAAGNMIRDDNSHISKIEYNFLHLPKQITKENFTQTQADGTQKMVQQENTYFHYTAAGQKLMYECKTTYADGTHLWTQIMYEGIVVYKGTSTNVEQAPLLEIDYIHHPEGRIRVSKVNQALQFTYEYHLKDHVGNTRVAFDAVQTGTSIFYKHAVAFQATDYYSFGMEHEQPNPYAPTLGQEHNQNFRYNGKEFYSGIGWSDYGFRFYNASIGRFMNLDPLLEQKVMQSPYVYAANNPIKYIDYMGLYEAYTTSDPEEIEKILDMLERNKKITSDIFEGMTPSRASYNEEKNAMYITWGETNKEGNGVVVNSKKINFNKQEQKQWSEFAKKNMEKDVLSGGGNFKNSNLALEIGGGIYGGLRTAVTPGDQWLGKNGKYYNNSWGGNRYTGSRLGALKAASRYKIAGGATIIATAIIGGIETYQGYQIDGNQFGYNAQSSVAQTVGGIGGGVGGAVLGAKIGGAFGALFGGFGAIPGAIVGGFIGGYFFGELGSDAGQGAVNLYHK